MKRLIKKSDALGTSFTFSQVRQYIQEKVPYTLFGLSIEEQEKLGNILNLFEGAVKEASDFSGFGMPILEVGVVDMDILAYYLPGSGVLTINGDEDKLQELFSAAESYIEMIGVHEYGHYVDEKLGEISQTDEWEQAIDSTSTNYLEGYNVTSTTDQLSEQFANVFVATVWQAQSDNCTTFIENALKN